GRAVLLVPDRPRAVAARRPPWGRRAIDPGRPGLAQPTVRYPSLRTFFVSGRGHPCFHPTVLVNPVVTSFHAHALRHRPLFSGVAARCGRVSASHRASAELDRTADNPRSIVSAAVT